MQVARLAARWIAGPLSRMVLVVAAVCSVALGGASVAPVAAGALPATVAGGGDRALGRPEPGAPLAPRAALAGLALNGGALTTTAPVVLATLTVAAGAGSSPAEVSFSNDGGVTWSPWQPFGVTLPWTLSAGDGAKTVQARARDAAGQLLGTAGAQIVLDTAAGTTRSVTVNGGDPFTRSTAVTLRIGAPPGTAFMQVSNDSAFRGAPWEPYSATKRWELDRAGAPNQPRSVYVRVADLANNIAGHGPVSDAILLDETPPTGLIEIRTVFPLRAAQANRIELGLVATDEGSGVESMRLSNDGDLGAVRWQAYQDELSWDIGSGRTVYAQFRDRAGNVSQVVSKMLATYPCVPRPQVVVASRPSNGALVVTVTATGAGNRLQALRFARLTNASVEVGGQAARSEPFAFAPPAGQEPASIQFTVRRLAAGQAATVQLSAVDGCGDWSTLVGGGPGAF